MGYVIKDNITNTFHPSDATSVLDANSRAKKAGIKDFGVYKASEIDDSEPADQVELNAKIASLRAEGSKEGSNYSPYSAMGALLPSNANLPADAGLPRKIASGALDVASYPLRAGVSGFRVPDDVSIGDFNYMIGHPSEGLTGPAKVASDIISSPINYVPLGALASVGKIPSYAAKLAEVPGIKQILGAGKFANNALEKLESFAPTDIPGVNLLWNTAKAAPRAAAEGATYTGASNVGNEIQNEPTSPFLKTAGVMTGAGAVLGGVGKSISQALPERAVSQLSSILDFTNKEKNLPLGQRPDVKNLLAFQSNVPGSIPENIVPYGNAKTLQGAYEEKLNDIGQKQSDALASAGDWVIDPAELEAVAKNDINAKYLKGDLDPDEKNKIFSLIEHKAKQYRTQAGDIAKSDGDVGANVSLLLAAAKKTKTGREAKYEYVNDPKKTTEENVANRAMNDALRQTMSNPEKTFLPGVPGMSVHELKNDIIPYMERNNELTQQRNGVLPIGSIPTESYSPTSIAAIKQTVDNYYPAIEKYGQLTKDYATMRPLKDPINREVTKASNRGISPSEYLPMAIGAITGVASGHHITTASGIGITALLHFAKYPGAASIAYDMAKQMGPEKAIPIAIRLGLIDPAIYEQGKQ